MSPEYQNRVGTNQTMPYYVCTQSQNIGEACSTDLSRLLNRVRSCMDLATNVVGSIHNFADRANGGKPIEREGGNKPSRAGSIGELEDAIDALEAVLANGQSACKRLEQIG